MMKGPFGVIIMGVIAVIIALVMFNVALNQLDTAMTSVNATTNNFPGLYDVMGIWGMVLFIVLMGAGIGMIGGGAYAVVRPHLGGGRSRRR